MGGRLPSAAARASVPANLDLVVVELGTDDMARTDATTFATAYAGLLLGSTPTPPTGGPPGQAGSCGASDDVDPDDTGHRPIATALLGAPGLTLP